MTIALHQLATTSSSVLARAVSQHYASIVALALVLAGLSWPTRAGAQEEGPQCLLCNQVQLHGDVDGDGDEEFYWYHAFDLDSGDACEEEQAEMCRACGWESECHTVDDDDDGIGFGKCHEECVSSFVLRDLDRQVTTVLAGQLDSETGPVLAARVASESNLVYQVAENAVALVGCQGVVKRWILDESGRLFFAAGIAE